MSKEEIRREIKRLVNKCIYLDIMDFVDVVYSHFEKKGIYDYKTIDKIIKEYSQYVIFKNN